MSFSSAFIIFVLAVLWVISAIDAHRYHKALDGLLNCEDPLTFRQLGIIGKPFGLPRKRANNAGDGK